jgi:hypothetical protein
MRTAVWSAGRSYNKVAATFIAGAPGFAKIRHASFRQSLDPAYRFRAESARKSERNKGDLVKTIGGGGALPRAGKGRRAAMKLTRRPRAITSVSFLRGARQYRLAAAVSDAPRDVKRFLDLAMMFELLSEQFTQSETRLHLVAA